MQPSAGNFGGHKRQRERVGGLHVSHKGELDCGHLCMPFPVLPRIGRTMDYSAREKKSTPRVGGARVLPGASLNNGVGSNIVCC